MNGTIRMATPADAQEIHNLHTRSVRGLCEADYPPEVIDGWLKGRSPEGYKGIAKNEMYVFEREGRILGWSHVRPNGIVGLFVDAAHARQGVGRALFEHGLRLIREHTDEHLEFGATVTAAVFYEKCGCRRLSTSTVRKNDIDVPTVRMALPEKGANAARMYRREARLSMKPDVGAWMMNRMAGILLGLVVATAACTRAPQVSREAVSRKPVSTVEAVVLARQACQGVAEVPTEVDGVVTETNGSYVVTFPQSYPEGTEGGSFYARVVIEKATGRVVDGVEVSE